MSTYYDFYLEGKINGSWICLDRFAKLPDGKMKHCPLMWGQSVMRPLVDELPFSPVHAESLSPDVRKRFSLPNSPTEKGLHWIAWGCQSIPLAELSCDESRYEYEYYVPREAMNEFKNGDIDAIEYWITEAEFAQLSDTEKRGFTLFRWDDPWDVHGVRRKLYSRAIEAREVYEDALDYGTHIEACRVIVRIG